MRFRQLIVGGEREMQQQAVAFELLQHVGGVRVVEGGRQHLAVYKSKKGRQFGSPLHIVDVGISMEDNLEAWRGYFEPLSF
jgi:hypothetical protein